MISTILRHNNYRQLAASLQPMRQQWPLHGDNAYQRRLQAAANSLAAWKWVVDISAFQHSLECIILATLVLLKPTRITQYTVYNALPNGEEWMNEYVYLYSAS